MRAIIFTCIPLILNSLQLFAQVTGDYRSAGSGTWQSSVWERYDGTQWTGAAAAPDTSAGKITILNTHNITVDAALIVDELTINGGAQLILDLSSNLRIADGAGEDIVIAGTVRINNGNMLGLGSIVVQPGGMLIYANPVSTGISGALLNNGTINWQSGDIFFSAPSTITNDGTFTISSNNEIRFSTGNAGKIINNGVINKTSTGITTFTLGDSLINNNNIVLDEGTTITRNPVVTSGTIVLNAADLIHENSFTLSGGIITGQGHFTSSANFILNAHQEFPFPLLYAMDNSATITGPGNLRLNQDFEINGNITGPGTLVVHGLTTWNRGLLGRSLTNEPGRMLRIASPESKFIAAPIINNGTIDWQDGNIFFSTTTTITNNDTFLISGNNEIRFSVSNAGKIINNGIINKVSAGTTIFTLGDSLINNNDIYLNGGTFITRNPVITTGTIVLNAADFVHENNFTLDAGIITGQGHFTSSASLILNAPQEFPFPLLYAMDNSATIRGPGNLTLNQDFEINGSILGPGTLDINGNTVWNRGTLNRNFTNEAGRTFTVTSTESKYIAAPFFNNGKINWQDGDLYFISATLTNNDSLLISGNNNLLLSVGETGHFENNGPLIKTSAGTTSFLITAFNNNAGGSIKGRGIITFNGIFNNNGHIAPGLSPGMLELNGQQIFSSNSGVQIEIQDASGAGTGHDQLVRNSNLTLAGTLTVTEVGAVPNGLYTIIHLSAGSISGSFNNTTLPPGYSLLVNANNVQLLKSLIVTPVDLISFTANQRGTRVLLQWITENEINNNYFDVERSSNGINFLSIGRVGASMAPGSRKEYSFSDQPLQTRLLYYRLKQVDIDGRFTYSRTIVVHFIQEENSILLYPNPARDKIQIILNNMNYPVQVTITDMQGRLIATKQLNDQLHWQWSAAHLKPGMYILKAVDDMHAKTILFMKE